MKSQKLTQWFFAVALLAGALWSTQAIAANCSTSPSNCNASCQVTAPIVVCYATARDAYCIGYDANGAVIVQSEAHCRIIVVPIGEGSVNVGTGTAVPGP